MKSIHSYEEVIEIGKKSFVIIWGMGKVGTELICDLRLSGYLDYYICDTDRGKIEHIDNHIFPEDIIHIVKYHLTSIVVAVKSDSVVNDIIKEINGMLHYIDGNDAVEICRYIPESIEEMVNRRKEKGFFDGHGYRKALKDEDAINMLMDMIIGSKPFLFARWGAECDIVYRIKAGFHPSLVDCMYLKSNLGVFPITEELIESYYKIMENASTEIDILCAFYWQKPLEKLIECYSPNATIVTSALEYPFFNDPWTKALKGMKVLIIHPFAQLIEKQYKIRDKLFENDEVLPKFDLITYQAIQSLGGNNKYRNWVEALGIMQDEISKVDFDIALIGCGAYGMPLGAFIKSRMNKKAIHMGGSLQILFGIKGKRWEGNGYNYQKSLYNEYWVRPTDDLKPENYKNVEGGCYW